MILTAICVLAASCSSAQDVVLAERGHSASVQVVNCSPGCPTAVHAAEELTNYVAKLTGVVLPVVSEAKDGAVAVTLVCDGRADGDAFELTSDARGVRIAGGVRGVLYGVYELLETYGGVGWFASWHEVVPRLERFSVPVGLKVAEKPAFLLREPYWYDFFHDGDFAARLRSTGNSTRLGEKHGGRPMRFSSRLGTCHTFYVLVPPEKFFKDHPEYFAEVQGRRQEKDSQLCLTNPDVLAIATSNVLAEIRREPDRTFFGVSQNDNMRYCTCARCKAVDDEEGSHAGTVVRFVNAIADAVAAEFPDKVIETLAYQYTRKPPKKTRLRPNVMPCLCTIECDFANPIATGTDPQNVSFRADIAGWKAQTDQLFIWDYTTNFRHFLLEFPDFGVLQANVRFFRDHGAKAVFEQGCGNGPHAAFAELKAWLLAKWLWNPDLPAEPLLSRFFTGYYGKAAPFVRRYFDALVARQRTHSGPGGHRLGIYEDPGESATADDGFLAEAADLWRQAERAVANEPAVYGRNVRMGAMTTDYHRFLRCAPTLWVTRHPETFIRGEDGPTLARRLLARFAEGKSRAPVRLAESPEKNGSLLRRIETVAARTEPIVAADVAEGSAKLIHNDWCKLADDPLAEGGKAVRLPGTGYGWLATLPMEDVAYDAGATYTVAVRVRVERDADMPDGEVLWAGVYDGKNKKGVVEVAKKASQCGDDWTWVDVATWRPSSGQYLWLSAGRFDKGTLKANPALKALYVDRVRISRCSFGWQNETPPILSK